MSPPRTALEIAQGKHQEEIVEESFQAVGKAVKGVFDFLTSDNNEEFLKRVDTRHGSNLGELYKACTTKAGTVAATIDEARERAAARPELPSSSSSSSSSSADVAGDDDVVVIVEEERPECGFCHGKQVVSWNPRTKQRAPMACPECTANPSATKERK